MFPVSGSVDLSEFWLSDERFQRLRPLLPDKVRGVARVDDRRVISGIIHVLKSGSRWVDAPACYGPRKTLYNRFVRWAEKGVWRDVFVTLATAGGPLAEVLIDSTHMKAHRSAGGGKGGRSYRQSGSAAVAVTASSTPLPTAKADRSDSC
ncbi:transposase [Sphingobium yanoikuyae]|uniref:transposase n=1 Tax=Sphingobium yanoikuyae TaxID=13690 RepID=UPI00406D0B0D